MSGDDGGEAAAKRQGPERVLGSPKDGCRHCQTVMTATSEKGLVIYFPALECCAAALLDRIQAKNNELAALKDQVDRDGVVLPGTKERVFEALGERDRLHAKLRELEH